MAYTRVASGDPGNSGATSAVTVVNAHSDGLEALEAGVVNVAANGVVADTRVCAVNTVNGSSTVTATLSAHDLGASVFSASDVGKAIHIALGSGMWLRTTVATFVSPTTVTVTSAPTITSSTASVALVGTDNTAALDAVCSALTDNQVLCFPASEYWYLTDGGHTIDAASVVVAGAGRHASRIACTSSTADVFTFTRPATFMRPAFAEVRDLTFNHGAGLSNSLNAFAPWPTAGSAIKFTSYYFSGSRVRNVAVDGFYVGVDAQSGQVQVDDSVFQSNYLAGVRCDNVEPDYGMFSIRGCHFAWSAGGRTTGSHGVLWIKGGGLGVTDCRFDGRQQYHVALTFDGAAYTGNIRISDNMFEDFGTNAIRITVSDGIGDLGYISIADNVVQGGASSPFYLWAASHGSARSRPASDYGICAVSISGNTRYNGSGTFIDLTRCRDVAVIGNRQLGGGTVLAQANCLNVTEV